MGLKLRLETLDGLDAGIAALYIKDGDGFKLDADGVEDVSGLKSALQKQKDANKALKDEADKYKGLGDPETIKQIMGRMANDEEAKLIGEGKIDQVIAKRTEKLQNELNRQVEEANGRATKSEERAKKFSQRVLDDHLRAAAMTAGVHASAVDDALFRGRSIFTLNEDGDAVQLDSDGSPIPGKDGKTPFSPNEWIGGMKEKAPHWFPAKQNGGGGGGSGKGPGGADLSKMSPTARLDHARGVT